MDKNKKTKEEQKKDPYLPNERDYLEAKSKEVRSYSKNDSVELPDNVRDPIIANNISNVEFDYTYNDGDDI